MNALSRTILSHLITPALIIVLVLGIFGLVRLRASVTSIEYEIGEMERERMGLMQERKTLHADLAALSSIAMVEARGLSLNFPDRQRVFYVKHRSSETPYTASIKPEVQAEIDR